MSDSALSIAFNPAGIELDPKLGLSRQLSPSRSNGLNAVLQRMRELALS